MISIFNYMDFRYFLTDQFKSLPKAGYGQSRRLANHLEVHTTLISQVLRGKKSFSLEQAVGVCEFLSLSDIETDYFLLLIQLDRAGTPALRKNLARQLAELRAQSNELVNRLASKRTLGERDRAIFYSDWAYSAVRQQIAINGFQTLEAIADHFGFTRRRTKEILEFLLSVQLCLEEKGILKVGPAMTHLESTSPWVRVSHMNWRAKAIAALDRENQAKLNYTAPMTLSKSDAEKIREMIAKFLESVDSIVEPSPSEALYCLNIDWFEVTR